MEELQAKWTFDQGGLAKAVIVPTPMGSLQNSEFKVR